MAANDLAVPRARTYRILQYLAWCTFLAIGTALGSVQGLELRRVLGAELLLIPFALAGARLGHGFLRRRDGRRTNAGSADPERGASLYGAAALAALSAVPVALLCALPPAAFLDLAVIAGLAALLPARLGCRARGCCGGHRRGASHQLLDGTAAVASAALALLLWSGLSLPGGAAALGIASYGALRWLLDARRAGGDRPGSRLNRRLFGATALASAALLATLALLGPDGSGPSALDLHALRLPLEWFGAAALLAPLALLVRFVGCGLLLDTDPPDPEPGSPIRVGLRITLPPGADTSRITAEIEARELGVAGAVPVITPLTMTVLPGGAVFEGVGDFAFRREHLVVARFLRAGATVRMGDCTGTPDAAGQGIEFDVDETAPGVLRTVFCFGPRFTFRGGGGFEI